MIHRATVGLGLISIHALHEESDFTAQALYADHPISIHALHEESDSLGKRLHCRVLRDFNPRSP